MIIKEVDSKKRDIDILTQLLRRCDLSEANRCQIQKRLNRLYSGIKGEAESAYQLNFYFGQSHDWIILHDLRLVDRRQVAQIDHLLINRCLQIFVCESKRVAGSIIINEFGEFSHQYQGKIQGMPSPLQQNKRHITILKNILKTQINLPKRMGIKLQPSINSLILVANEAHIQRPKNRLTDLNCIIKNEQIKTAIASYTNKFNVLPLLKKISSAALQNFGEQLCNLHRPAPLRDWYKYFGIYSLDNNGIVMNDIVSNDNARSNHQPPQPDSVTIPSCPGCDKPLSLAEIQYCQKYKEKFATKAYCYQCQRKMKTS